jgi:hypothetical protein
MGVAHDDPPVCVGPPVEGFGPARQASARSSAGPSRRNRALFRGGAGVSFRDHFSGVAEQYARAGPSIRASWSSRLAALAPARRTARVGRGVRLRSALHPARRRVRRGGGDRRQPAADRRGPAARAGGVSDRASRSERAAGRLRRSVRGRAGRALVRSGTLLPEVRRVARPGGADRAGDVPPPPRRPGACSRRWTSSIRTVGPYWPPERAPVEELYANVPFPFAEDRLPPMWMEQSWPLEQLLGYAAHLVVHAGLRARGRPGAARAARRPVRDAWGDPARLRVSAGRSGARGAGVAGVADRGFTAGRACPR